MRCRAQKGGLSPAEKLMLEANEWQIIQSNQKKKNGI